MNRRKKFYSRLGYDLEEEDYDDDYDEDDYYEEECVYYSDNQKDARGVKEAQSVSPPADGADGLRPEDMDHPLVAMLLPLFEERWAEIAATREAKVGIAQRDVVSALRDSNYDVEEAVMLALQRGAVQEELGTETQRPQQLSSAPVRDSGTAAASAPLAPKAPTPGGRTLKLGQGNKKTAISTAKDTKMTLEPTSTAKNSTNVTCGRGSQKKEPVLDVMPESKKKDSTFVIAGHVDAGKSTTLGHLLLLLGKVSQAEVENNEKDARLMNKESFKYAWLLDQSEEERRRGVTIDAGSYCFETEHRRIYILDAPGHKDYFLSMISSATQADAALLVVTATTSEFDVGLAHGTRDHLLVLKILGVSHLVVAVNKMDAVNFSQERYDYAVENLSHLLKQVGFKEKNVAGFCPISGMQGSNILKIDPEVMPWYNGPSLVELLDQCPLKEQLLDAPLRLSLQDVQGTRLYCKVESGRLQKASKLFFVPSDVEVDVKSIVKPTVGGLVDVALAGDTVEIDARSTPVGLLPGYVGCPPTAVLRCSTDFEARVQTLTTLQKSILPGTTLTMVVHALTVPVEVVALVSKMDRQGNWSTGMVKCIPKATQARVLFRANHKIALEPAEVCRALGCFVLLQDGSAVAGGFVEKMIV